MGTRQKGASTRTSRLIKAPPEDVYRAFLDPAALVAWLPPSDMTAKVHAFDPRVGGGYQMSLFYPASERSFRGKTAEKEDRVNVRFVELAPPRRIVEAITFVSDDPAFHGEMTETVTLEARGEGTLVTLAFDNLPQGIRPEDNEAGAQSSLEKLAQRLER
jgi:uncharacterized protein YndB with AHSA1/START domain